jgi:hypothetical protein
MMVDARVPPSAFQGGFFPACRLAAALCLPFGGAFLLAQALLGSGKEVKAIGGAIYPLTYILIVLGLQRSGHLA